MNDPGKVQELLEHIFIELDSSQEEIQGSSKHDDVVEIRQTIGWLMHEGLGCSHQEIAHVLNRGRSTVSEILQTAREKHETDPEFAWIIAQLASELEIEIDDSSVYWICPDCGERTHLAVAGSPPRCLPCAEARVEL